jgi:hypothetical protein
VVWICLRWSILVLVRLWISRSISECLCFRYMDRAQQTLSSISCLEVQQDSRFFQLPSTRLRSPDSSAAP